MSLESFIMNTLSIGAAFTGLNTKVLGCSRFRALQLNLWCELQGGAKNPSPGQEPKTLHSREDSGTYSAVLYGVRHIVIGRALRRAFRRCGSAVRLTAASHGHDTGAHHFQYPVGTQHFEQPVDLVFPTGNFDGQ